jgi:hypothetical protein
MLTQIGLQSGNFDMSVIQGLFLLIKLGVKIGVLLLSVYQEVSLIINFLSEGSNHSNVGFNSGFVIIFHLSFLVSYSIKVLLKV